MGKKVKKLFSKNSDDEAEGINLIEDFMQQENDSEGEQPTTGTLVDVSEPWSGKKDKVRKNLNSRAKEAKMAMLRKKLQEKISILRQKRKADGKEVIEKTPKKSKKGDMSSKTPNKKSKKDKKKTPAKKVEKQESSKKKKSKKDREKSAKKSTERSHKKYQLKMTKLIKRGRQPLINESFWWLSDAIVFLNSKLQW